MFAFACPTESPETLIQLRRLVASRWWVLGLMSLCVFGVPALLEIPLPQWPMLGILFIASAFNALANWRLREASTASACEMFSQLLLDIAALSALVFFSGGAANPLVSLLLPPVAIAALSLPARHTAIITGSAIAAYSLLMIFYLPLPVSDASRATRLHLGGMWLIFVISALLIGWLIVRMTQLIRQRDAELATAREQALRDERMLAMGTLAAGAAHELGTPLATMKLIVGELTNDTSLPKAVHEDLALIHQQIDSCKQIITGLLHRAAAERLEDAALQPLDRWLGKLRQHWHATRPQAASTLHLASSGPPPAIIADPRLEQAVLNLLNNAANAASSANASALEISLNWDSEKICINIRDHGPGFPPSVLRQGGHQPFPAHSGGSGMGLLLTQNAITQLGGQLTLSNPAAGGALACIELPRKDR